VYDPEKILRKAREQAPDPFYFLDRSLSLPKDGVQSIDDLEFDALFEQTLFRSKSETSLDKTVFDPNNFQALVTNNIPQNLNPPRAMAARFTPLILPAQLHDLPQNYSQRIRLYDAEGNVSAEKHLDWFNDFVDLEEVDYADAKMRLFAQILSGDVRKWFKSLPPMSIRDFAAFERSFLNKWGDKKNPLQLLTQYNNMKKAPEETVQEFSAHFLKVYNSIPAEVNPPPGAAQLWYADSFDSDFALLLRERRSTSLDAIMSNVVEVEVNMMASGKIKPKFNRGDKRPQGDAQSSTSWSSDDKFDMMMKTMEKLMERMSVGNRPVAREQNDPQPRNQNLRRGQIPQIKQRDPGDQQMRPPFQNNYADEDLTSLSMTRCIVVMTKTRACS
jgi:hypothetical protein